MSRQAAKEPQSAGRGTSVSGSYLAGPNAWPENPSYRLAKHVWILLAMLLALRLFLVVLPARHPQGGVLVDSQHYMRLAARLVQSGDYTDEAGQDLVWPPGYPLFIAMVSGWKLPSTVAAALAQLMVTVLITSLIVVLGRRLDGGQGRAEGAWLYALLPTAALWALTVMSETLFAALLLLGCLAWVVALERRSTWWGGATGAFLGLAAMVRPIGLVLLPLWILLGLPASGRAGGRVALTRFGIAMLLGAGLVVVPWSIRNLAVHGELAFSRVAERTFFNFNIAQVMAGVEGISRDAAASELGTERGNVIESLRLITAHPIPFALEQGRGIFRTMLGLEAGSWARLMALPGGIQEGLGIVSSVLSGDPRLALSRLSAIALNPSTGPILVLAGVAESMTILLYTLAAAYMIGGRKDGLGLAGLLFWSAVVLAVVPAAAGQARFRIPIEPMLCILAGPGLSVVARALRPRGTGSDRQDPATAKAKEGPSRG